MLRNMISALLQEKLQLKEFVLHQKSEYFAKGTQPAKCTYHSAFSKRVQAIQKVQVHPEVQVVPNQIALAQNPVAQAPAIQSQVLIVQNQVQVEPIQEVLEQANQVQVETDSGSSRTSKSSSGSSSSKGSVKLQENS